jgi:RNA polymerase sigma factor (sigma-70 family)
VESWARALAQGDGTGAWDLFVERYRRLILATIRRITPDGDDAMDVFATVCQALSENDFARLRSYNSAASTNSATVATWLVVTVRNISIDWLRARDGRSRFTPPDTLSPLHQRIYIAICRDGHSYADAYEVLRDHLDPTLSFGGFLREVTAMQRIAPCTQQPRAMYRAEQESVAADGEIPIDVAQMADVSAVIDSVFAAESPEVRLAVRMLIVERASAASIATLLRWPNAKAVYNRVYRALEAAQDELRRRGIDRDALI